VIDLDARLVEAELEALGSAFGKPVTVAFETTSTNDDAKRAAGFGAPNGAVFLADTQSRGRGRSGHTWFSPPSENLYLSIVLRPRLALAALPPLALVVGVCVARVVDQTLDRPAAMIKWPNDVYVDGKKLAGILVESSLRGGVIDAVIVGIGVNVHASSFPEDLASRATSLRVEGARDLDRSRLAARLVASMGCAIERYEHQGIAAFLPELARRDALFGVSLEVSDVRGVGAGIDEDGSLLIEQGADLRRVGSGSVMTFGPLARGVRLDPGACATGR